MKSAAFAISLLFFSGRLFCQTSDPVFDSLSQPLPAGAGVRKQAERLKNVLQYILMKPEIGFGNYPRQMDSLYRCCIAGKTDDPHFEIWVQAVSAYYLNTDNFERWEEGKRILRKTIRQFESAGDSNMVATALVDLTYYALAQQDTLAFNKQYKRAMVATTYMDDLFLKWRVFVEMGNFSSEFGKYAQGMKLYFEALDCVKQYQTPLALYLQQYVCNLISNHYLDLDNFEQALLFAEQAIRLSKEGEMDDQFNYYQLGNIYERKKDYRRALEAYNLVGHIPDEPYLVGTKAGLLIGRAACYRNLGDTKKALSLAKQALNLLHPARADRLSALRELAECELAAGKTDSALQHALQVHEVNLAGTVNVHKSGTASLLSRIYEAKGDFQKAFEYLKSARQYYDREAHIRQVRQIAGQEFERENAAKNARRETEIQAQLDRQRNIRYALLAGLAMLALLAFLLYNRYRFKQRTAEQLEAKNREVEAARLRAEKSEAFKSRFLANMSHEIRTPLHGISGYTDLLLDTSLTEKQRRYLSSVRQSNERLTEVVNDILDLSKLEAGEVKLRQVPFSPAQIARDVQDALAPRAENKGIELSVEISENVPEALIGDPTRLYQILMNLAGNAVKFTETGSVTIAVSAPSPAPNSMALETLAGVTFTVADTGIGIPPEKLATIFDSFQQAGEDTTTRFGGTGLGLSIARELVQLHGSDIHVTSTPGKGSTFSFDLVLPPADTADLEKTADAGNDLFFSKKLKILLADDNDFNREIAVEALLRHFENAEIAEAHDGAEAVQIFEKQPFDIVLMDMQMPGMTGTEATRYIRQSLHSDIPVIALTASATPEEIENALASGMNRHLAKPFKPHELARAIAQTLGLAASDFPGFKNLESLTPPPAFDTAYDLKYLRDFCDGDEAQVRHFIEKFETQWPLEMVKLEAAFSQNDREAIYRAAHRFRPQLEFVGLKDAASLVFEIEQGARTDESMDALTGLLEQLKKKLKATKA